MNIIGLGQGGCKIAKQFEQYSQYKIFCVDVKEEYDLAESKTMEEAEKNFQPFPELTKKVKGPTCVFLVGGGIVSGSLMALIGSLTNANVSVAYIRPDKNFLNPRAKLRDNLVYKVLQEYARSGAINRLFLLGNDTISDILGDLSIAEYFETINKTIASTFHMLNYLDNISSVMSNVSEPMEVNRISTLGYYDSSEGEEKYFYDLQNIREKNFFYTFSQKTLSEEKNLLNKISNQIMNAGQEDFTTVSYSITSTSYEENYVYLLAHTNFTQE